jgi:cobalt-precorrin 5A hydrolase/precorrin-3B C17-methyltransferase
MKPPAIVILGETSFAVARQVQTALPAAVVYGLAGRTRSAIVTYANLTSESWENAIALWVMS